jgi:DNA invertase Pin-like site-specific DNA recombinase
VPQERSQNWTKPYADAPFIQCVKRLHPDGSVIGYARVSTDEQELDMQISALKAAGCERIYLEKASTRKKRPVWEMILKLVTRENDTLIIWRLDRLGRDLIEMVQTVEDLYKRGIRVQSLQENIDPTTASGKLMLGILASFAQYERDLTRERTIAGIAEAKRRGVEFGNPTQIHGEKRLEMLIDIWNPKLTNKQITERAGYKSTATLFNHFKGVRGQVKVANKQGEREFNKQRKEALTKCAQEEGISMKRMNEIIKSKESIGETND